MGRPPEEAEVRKLLQQAERGGIVQMPDGHPSITFADWELVKRLCDSWLAQGRVIEEQQRHIAFQQGETLKASTRAAAQGRELASVRAAWAADAKVLTELLDALAAGGETETPSTKGANDA